MLSEKKKYIDHKRILKKYNIIRKKKIRNIKNKTKYLS